MPHDITEDEILSHFSKAGLIAVHAHDQSPKIKLYRDDTGEPKGDCSVCYHSHESVTLALTILDGGYIRIFDQISVKIADFTSATSGVTSGSTGASINADDKGKSTKIYDKDGKGRRDSSRAGVASERE